MLLLHYYPETLKGRFSSLTLDVNRLLVRQGRCIMGTANAKEYLMCLDKTWGTHDKTLALTILTIKRVSAWFSAFKGFWSQIKILYGILEALLVLFFLINSWMVKNGLKKLTNYFRHNWAQEWTTYITSSKQLWLDVSQINLHVPSFQVHICHVYNRPLKKRNMSGDCLIGLS